MSGTGTSTGDFDDDPAPAPPAPAPSASAGTVFAQVAGATAMPEEVPGETEATDTDTDGT